MNNLPFDAPSHSIDDIRTHLEGAIYDGKVKSPWLNKNIVMVQRRAALVTVKLKNGVPVVNSGINTQYPGIMIPFILGILFGFLGALVVLAIAYPATTEARKTLKQDVEDALAKM